MSRASKSFIVLVGAVGLLLLVTAGSAIGSHARPKGATTTVLRLVPAHNGCPGFDRWHEPPVLLQGCPADETSASLTFNAPDRPAPYNTAADGTGYVQIRAFCTNAQTLPCVAVGDQEDIELTLSVAGVRCLAVSGGCAAAGGTYSGKVLVSTPLRITDHRFGPFGGPYNQTGSTEYPATFGAQCAAGTCNVNTTLESIIPSSTTVSEGTRQSLEILSFNVFDGGPNGNLAPLPNPPTTGVCPPACQGDDGESVFLRNGVFAP